MALNTCSNMPCDFTASTDTCLSVTGTSGCLLNQTTYRVKPYTASGQCASSPGTVAPATFADAVVACGGVSGGSCAGGVCVPEPPPGFDTAYCVGKAGDTICPSSYPVRTLAYRNIDDRRVCDGVCSCARDFRCVAVGASCSSTMGSVVDEAGMSSCSSVGGDLEFVLLSDPTFDCTPSGSSSVSGTADAIDPVTICCES